ncbi:MAG: hypothetical protein ACJAWV_001196 [Flammeovirgaceae bacterium]|jgi:hypothetical protein
MRRKIRLGLLLTLLLITGFSVYFWQVPISEKSDSDVEVKIRKLAEAPKKFKEAVSFEKNNKEFTPTEALKAKMDEKRARRKAGYVKKFDNPDLYAQMYEKIRTKEGESIPGYVHGYQNKEIKNARKLQANVRTKASDWTSRGPANVPGRTRAFQPLPSDPQNTWLAGAAGGGIWKTTDKGANWVDKTPDFSSLSIANITMSGNTIYAGTGEIVAGSIEVNGDGIYKSTDEGETWTQIPSTASNDMFRNVTRIVADPNDANTIVVVASNYNRDSRVTRILRTTDGGVNWDVVYSRNGLLNQIAYKPGNFDIQLASVSGLGIIKSTDGGLTWNNSNSGLSAVTSRLEIAFSPANPSKVYLSVVGNASGSGSDLYVSDNSGDNWSLVLEEAGGVNQNFLGGQGSYDNTIMVNPYNEDEVYLGGVSLWKVEVTDGSSSVFNLEVEEDGTDVFMTYSPFGFSYLGGGLEVNEPGTLSESEIVDVEVRFGSGLTQKAHRFTVNKQGSGVAPTGYTYQDYVDVPFQVWDVTNNKQLMVSFRDQKENGVWNLVESNLNAGDAEDDSREYTFIHAVDYNDASPDAGIAQNGGAGIGHQFRQMYFIAPQLVAGFTFDANTLPSSKLKFTVANIIAKAGLTTNVTDSYGDFGGKNGWTNDTDRNDGGVHPDHHLLTAIKIDESANTFMVVDCSDGGVYYSNTSETPGVNNGDWSFGGMGYITSQFHGVDKMPGEEVYIGGMQDNSVWRSPLNEVADDKVLYSFMGAGDGFDCIWHKDDPNKIIASSQFNNFFRTTNAGQTWVNATNGLDATGQGQGSFFSPLASSQTNPDLIFTVGSSGVWYSEDFGASWNETPITSGSWGGIGGIPQIKVSDANNKIVWAGNAMLSTINMHVSTDAGQSFTPTNNFANMGAISGFAVHPTEANTAYALFSFAGNAKIVRTTDLGQTWEDISGFDSGSPSSNGFPDVAVFDLVVLPFETNTIWAGTEIGVFESNDNGVSWHMLESDLPAVAVYDMKLVDNQIVIGTHGRGIWSSTFSNLPTGNPVLSVSINSSQEIVSVVEISPAFDSTQLLVNTEIASVTTETGNVEITLTGYESGVYTIQAISYFNGIQYGSLEKTVTLVASSDILSSYSNDFEGVTSDFITNSLTIKSQSGFSGKAIHSAHNYANNTNNTIVLDKAIEIAATSEEAFIEFKEIAIVETGDPGSSFGTPDFFDYVIVETSYDKDTWFPVSNGYDASDHSEWLAAYNSDAIGTESLYKTRKIDLINSVSPLKSGDIVYFRFRLFADNGSNAWGWVIDNLLIQTDELIKTPPTENPTLLVTANESNEIVSIINIQSAYDSTQLLVDGDVVQSTTETGSVEIRLSDYDAGTYKIQAISYFDGTQYKSEEKTIELSEIPTGIEDDIKANRVGLEVYPNPASIKTTLKYFLPQASAVTFNVIDNSGKIVRTIYSDYKNKGLYEQGISLSDLPKGVYIVQVSSVIGMKTSRLIVQ